MKTISLWQPYASLIGIKEIETRSWYTKHRGDLAIHASKNLPPKVNNLAIFNQHIRDAIQKMFPYSNPIYLNYKKALPLGAIIRTCSLVECCLIKADGLYKVPNGMPVRGEASFTEYYAPLPGEPERSFGDYTPGRYAWILKDIKALPETIPAKGHQGLWEWEAPEGVQHD